MIWVIVSVISFATLIFIGNFYSFVERRLIAKRKKLFENDLNNRKQKVELEKSKRQIEIQLAEIEKIRKGKENQKLTKQKPGIDVFKKEKEQKNLEVEQKIELLKNQRYKSGWTDYQDILSSNNIQTLYHFTDEANIQSIKRNGGLYSWHYCLLNQIDIPYPGGNELSRSLDRKYGLQNYVRVCFTACHPMMFNALDHGRINNPLLLEIDTEVVFWKNAKYANMNATRKDVNIGSTLEDFLKIRFDLVRLRNHFDINDIEKPFFQAEILILEKIPIEFIKNINQL